MIELTQCPRQIWTTSDVIKVLALHLLLVRFTVIKVIEVADDNRHRQGDCQDTSNGT